MKPALLGLLLTLPVLADAPNPAVSNTRSILVSTRLTEMVLRRVKETWPERDSKGPEAKVLVLGQVSRPGLQPLKEDSLYWAIASAGGATRLGDRSHIFLLHEEVLTEYFLDRSNPPEAAKRLPLHGGDVLFVEYQCTDHASVITDLDKDSVYAPFNR